MVVVDDGLDVEDVDLAGAVAVDRVCDGFGDFAQTFCVVRDDGLRPSGSRCSYPRPSTLARSTCSGRRSVPVMGWVDVGRVEVGRSVVHSWPVRVGGIG